MNWNELKNELEFNDNLDFLRSAKNTEQPKRDRRTQAWQYYRDQKTFNRYLITFFFQFISIYTSFVRADINVFNLQKTIQQHADLIQDSSPSNTTASAKQRDEKKTLKSNRLSSEHSEVFLKMHLEVATLLKTRI